MDGPTDRETERQIHELKTSWLLGVPPKGLEVRAITFGGKEGSMLGRRGWFDALSKGMVQCQIEGNGLTDSSMLGRRVSKSMV